MVAGILAELSPGEIALAAIAVFGIGLIPVMMLSWMLKSCVGLKLPPTRRAALTVGLAYLVTLAIMAIWEPREFGALLALLPLPGALAVFAYQRHFHRKAWRANAAALP